jgi:hypothetical protein
VPYSEHLGFFSGTSYNWTAFEGLKVDHFDFSRRDAFHYVIYGDRYGGSDSSGISRGIPASDFLVTDGPWGSAGFSRTQERGTFMHEFGHNLTLFHGGDGEARNGDPAYRSIMNYSYQLVGLPPDSRVDYSRGAPFVDWNVIRFDGGSVGDLGDSVPLPIETESEELDPQTAKEGNFFAAPGDGTVQFVGPSLLLAGSGTRSLLFDVKNISTATDTFTVDLTTTLPGTEDPAPISVGPESTVRVSVPVSTTELVPGNYVLSVSLSSSKVGESISEDSGEVVVPDLSQPSQQTALSEALQQLQGQPEGLDPALRLQLIDMLGSPTAPTCQNPGPNAIRGTARSDSLRGTSGDDVLLGLGGADKIEGRGGMDLICGGAGDDSLAGGAGNDRLYGESGHDSLTGGAGIDACDGGLGRNKLRGCEQ